MDGSPAIVRVNVCSSGDSQYLSDHRVGMKRGAPMAAKHRKTSRPAAVVAMVVAPAGLAAAAMALTSLPAPVPPDTTIAAPSVDLQSLVSAANSTSQFFAG